MINNIRNFTVTDTLHFSISINSDRRANNKVPVFMKVNFANTGNESLFIEPGFNLGHATCGSVKVRGGNSDIDCMGDICVAYLNGGRGLDIKKLDASNSINYKYPLGLCNFSDARPGVYNAEFYANFYLHPNQHSKNAEKEYNFLIQSDFELLGEEKAPIFLKDSSGDYNPYFWGGAAAITAVGAILAGIMTKVCVDHHCF